MNKPLKTAIRWIVSLAFVVASVYYALDNVDLSMLVVALQKVDYTWVGLCVPVIVLSHWIRAVRWRTMFTQPEKKMSLLNLFSAVMVGYAVNNVVPKGGELLRPYVFSKRERIPLSTSIATIIVERFLFDMVMVILIVAAVFAWNSNDILKAYPSFTITSFTTFVLLTVAMAVVVIAFSVSPGLAEWFLQNTVRRFSEPLYERAHHLLDTFRQGFSIVKTPGQYYRLTIETLSIWFLYVLPMWLCFYAFGFQHTHQLDFSDAILLFTMGTIAQFAPTPGAVGVFHGLVVAAMTNLYHIGREDALAYATITHGLNYFISFALGGVFFLRENKLRLPVAESVQSDLEEASEHDLGTVGLKEKN